MWWEIKAYIKLPLICLILLIEAFGNIIAKVWNWLIYGENDC